MLGYKQTTEQEQTKMYQVFVGGSIVGGGRPGTLVYASPCYRQAMTFAQEYQKVSPRTYVEVRRNVQ